MENYILRKALAGSIANSKDIHCGDESVQVSDLANLKPGYACMLNDKGEVVVSDGTSFYGVRAEEIVPMRIGNTENSVSIGVRRKGIVNVEINELYLAVDQYTGESTRARSEPINVKVKPYSGFTNLSGQKENTVKNMAVQFYMVAKVLV